MFELLRLKVCRFRGFVGEREFVFDKPVVLLYGENHRGKSSTLNAVEWCLFGDQCVGRKTGIRERIGWEILNRYGPGEGAVVTAEFRGPDGTYRITRKQARDRKRSAGAVTILLPDNTELYGDEAELRLQTLFRSSFQDFMTTVYQHQEAIRAILTREPRMRNEAIDRLLGLSEYREILRGIDSAKLGKMQKDMEDDWERFRRDAAQAIRIYEKLIGEEKNTAITEGIREEDITEHNAIDVGQELAQAVRSLAKELGVVDFRVTVPQEFDEIAQFREWVKTQTDKLWAQAPDVREQERLATAQHNLSALRANYQGLLESKTKAQSKVREFIGQYGDAATLAKLAQQEDAEIAELQREIHRTNARANLVKEAIQYLREVVSDSERRRCPLCAADAPQLLDQLEREWKDEIEVQVKQLEDQKHQHQSRSRRLRSLKVQLEGLDSAWGSARVALQECIDEIATALGREIREEHDPLALLNVQLAKIAEEVKAIGEAIAKKRETISGIYGQLTRLRIIHEILNYERKKATIEKIWETKEFAVLEELRDEASQLGEDASAITTDLSVASRKEAEDKIGAAETALDKYFCSIVNHPAVAGLTMKVTKDARTGLNSYTFQSRDGANPTPILSHGDLNCLALSLFLGLAEATSETQRFGFLIMDDPTQSLGSEMKQRLVNVLEDVLRQRTLIVATPDAEFRNLLIANITKRKTLYEFQDWTKSDGPTITRTT